ncbi:MAG TPA: branched-chain amino acid ABC transporter permease [Ktedonobacterales bacterium]|nr:branched-chain amino acid ABC transporter permease [Ktedonobacterales bacterium]
MTAARQARRHASSLRSATRDLPAAAAPPSLLGSSRSRALLVFGAILLALVFLFGGDTWLTILNYTLVAAVGTLALNVLSGYTGQISLGITFFMGIGAYTTAWLGGDLPSSPGDPAGLALPFFIWLPASGIVAALAGALVGPIALRLKGFYLGIVSLALVFIGLFIFTNVAVITGGVQGRTFPVPSIGSFSFDNPDPIFGIQLTSNQVYFLLLAFILGLAGLFVGNVMRSRAGRAFQAVRDNEVGASIMGVNLLRAKVGAFTFSSFLAGIAGSLWAAYPPFNALKPAEWSLLLAIQFVAAIIIGGIASVWGSILGAAFVFGLPSALDQLSIVQQSAGSGGIAPGDLNALIYGALIIVFLLFEPAGIIGLIRRAQAFGRRLDDRRKHKEGGEPASALLPDPAAPGAEDGVSLATELDP